MSEAIGIDLVRMGWMTLLMLLGTFGPFLQTMAALEEAGKSVSPIGYLRAHPYRVLNMLVSSELMLFVFEAMGELTAVAAILTGFACQHASEAMRRRAEARLNPPVP